MIFVKLGVGWHDLILIDTITACVNIQVNCISIENSLRDKLIFTPEPVRHKVVQPSKMQNSNSECGGYNESLQKNFDILLIYNLLILAPLVHDQRLRKQKAPKYFHLRSFKLVMRKLGGILQQNKHKYQEYLGQNDRPVFEIYQV